MLQLYSFGANLAKAWDFLRHVGTNKHGVLKGSVITSLTMVKKAKQQNNVINRKKKNVYYNTFSKYNTSNIKISYT